MKKNNLFITIGVIVVVLFALFILYDKLPSSNEKTITANGVSELSVVPDRAVVYIRIESMKETAEASKNDNSAKTNQVISALKKLDMNVETSQYNIYPEYDWSEEGQKIIGYKTTTVLKVNTGYFDDVGTIVDAAVNSGQAMIDSINFELSPERESEYKKQALEEASRDAKEKAEAIAAGMDVKLGKILSVTSNDFYYRPYPLYERSMGTSVKEAVETVIEPTNLDVNANVNVVYAIR
jgi:uncharacterized protein YggE